jgi:hypothetical protein
MAGFNLSIDLTPARELIKRVRAAILDLRRVWVDTARPLVSRFFERQFATAGAEGGTPWAPLSPATIAYKARFGRADMGILRFENHLWASLVNAPAPMGIEEITPDHYTRGTADPKAALHQSGFTVKGWGRIHFKGGSYPNRFETPRAVPARLLVPPQLPPAYVNELTQAIVADVERQAQGNP